MDNDPENGAPQVSAALPAGPQRPAHAARGRFVKGTSGNPAGRPRGILNRPKSLDPVLMRAWQELRRVHGNTEQELIALVRLCLERVETGALLRQMLRQKPRKK